MWNIIEYDEVNSTNSLASERLAQGIAEHGDVVQARHQTAGRGRGAGRVWNDEPGASLLFSVILKDIPEPAHLLQYRAAIAVLDALRRLARDAGEPEHAFRLKWPNDIFFRGKKISGLLLEAQWNGLQMKSAIIGIGVNVKQQLFPTELENIATSLRAGGIHTEITTVRDAILAELSLSLYFSPSESNESSSVLKRLRNELNWMMVLPALTLTSTDGVVATDLHFEGVTEAGSLRLRRPDGSLIEAHSGSVSW